MESLLVKVPLCARAIFTGLLVKNGWESLTSLFPAVGYLTWPIPRLPVKLTFDFVFLNTSVTRPVSLCRCIIELSKDEIPAAS